MTEFPKVNELVDKFKANVKIANHIVLAPNQINSHMNSFLNDEQGKTKGYMPEGFIPPEECKLLIQLNFSQMPELKGYPNSGILQVWTKGDDMFDRHENNDGTVIYHKDTTLLQQDIEIEDPATEDPFGLNEALEILFVGKTETYPAFYSNEYYASGIGEGVEALTEKEQDKLYEIIDETSSHVHYVGGCPYFSQNDITEEGEVVLLQLGYCEHLCIGDAGTFQIVVQKKDLENLDFSNAFCNWDCH